MYQSQKTLHIIIWKEMTPHQKDNKKVIWYILEALDWFLWTHQKIIFIRSPVTEKQLFKNLKILSSLACLFQNRKKDHDLNFPSVKYFGKSLSFLKIWQILVDYYWNYGPSNLLFRSTWYSWQQFNNRQSEAAVNLLIHFFER